MTMAAATPTGNLASKTLVIGAFIATTLFTTVVGGIVTYWVGIESAKHQAYLSERSNQVNQFVDPAEAFDLLVVKFVKEVAEGRVTEETKGEIKANLIAQRSALERADNLVSESEAPLIDRYVDLLAMADAGAKKSTGALDSRDFAQASAHIADLRPKVIKSLRNG